MTGTGASPSRSRSSRAAAWSSGASGSEPSRTKTSAPASRAAARDRSTPSRSMGSSLGVSPAVSTRCRAMSRRRAVSSMVSRVVPATGVTMARSMPSSVLSSDDLPALGRPTSATRSPSRSTRPRSTPASSRAVPSAASLSSARNSSRVGRRDLLLREVNAGLDANQRPQRRRANRRRPRRKLPLELAQRQPPRRLGARVHQVHHRLSLRQVNAAIEEGAQRHLAGTGQPRARRQRQRQDAPQRQRRAVRLNLHHILAGVGARRAHEDCQRLVHQLAAGGVHDVAVDQQMRLSGAPPSVAGCAGGRAPRR